MKQMSKQAGFTLIELVTVIVILGILAAVALPRFVNFGTNASLAAAQGVAGAMSSAASINVANRSLTPANGVSIPNASTPANVCTTGAAPGSNLWTGNTAIMQGGFPAGFALAADATSPATCAVNGTVICRVTENQQGQFALATIACIP